MNPDYYVEEEEELYVPKIWLIPDPHFNHQKLEIEGHRPVGFTELIKKNWKLMADNRDDVYVLGDVILGQNGTLGAILADLPGRKILVRGNHDHQSNGYYERNGFYYVAQGILTGGVWLSHHPAMNLPSGAILNVHGHLHNSAHHGLPADYPAHCKLLSLEQQDYKPVELNKFVGFSPIMRKLLL